MLPPTHGRFGIALIAIAVGACGALTHGALSEPTAAPHAPSLDHLVSQTMAGAVNFELTADDEARGP